MSQTKYTNVQVYISENQKLNLKRAMENGDPISIRLSYENLCCGDILALTNSQISLMKKSYENQRGLTIKMSKHNFNTT